MTKQFTPAFLLPILLVCAAILAVYFFLPRMGTYAIQGGAISLSIEGRPMVSGNNASLHAISTCGEFVVSLDKTGFGNGSAALSQPFLLEEGNHSFFAQGNGCNSTLAFHVAARQCEGNQTSECEKEGCPGIRKCAGGVFSSCTLPKKVCSPGERVGCSIDGCSFGYIICNQCGTGFGKCTADSKNENVTCATCNAMQFCN